MLSVCNITVFELTLTFYQNKQVPCYMTYTNAATHKMVRDNMHNSVHIQETKRGTDIGPLL